MKWDSHIEDVTFHGWNTRPDKPKRDGSTAVTPVVLAMIMVGLVVLAMLLIPTPD
jgi:hypothetical protein